MKNISFELLENFEFRKDPLDIDIYALLDYKDKRDAVYYSKKNNVGIRLCDNAVPKFNLKGQYVSTSSGRITVNIDELPRGLEKITIVSGIFRGEQRKQSFAMSGNLLALVDIDGDVSQFNIFEVFPNENCVKLWELDLTGNEVKVKLVPEKYELDISEWMHSKGEN